MRVEWSQHSDADLKRISEYIEQDRSLETANRVSRVVYDPLQSLQTMLYQGRPGCIEDTRQPLVQMLLYINRVPGVRQAIADPQHRPRILEMSRPCQTRHLACLGRTDRLPEWWPSE